MPNEITATVADVGLREVWISEALEGLYESKKVAKEPIIWVKQMTGKNKGDNIDFTEFTASSVNTVGADGTLTNQAITHTQRQVALSRWREVTWDVVDRVSAQSALDYSVEAPREQSRALGQDMDDSVLDDHGSFSGSYNIGDTSQPGPMNIDMILEAEINLRNAPVPETEPVHLALGLRAYAQLFKNELLAGASDAGSAKGAQVTGQIPSVLGYPLIRTSRVVSTGTPAVLKNFLLGRRAIAMGISTDLNPEVFRTQKSKRYSTDILYGEAVIRSNFAVVMNTKSAA